MSGYHLILGVSSYSVWLSNLAAMAVSVAFVTLVVLIRQRTGRITLVGVVGIAPVLHLLGLVWLAMFPYSQGQFRATDPTWVTWQLTIMTALNVAALVVELDWTRPVDTGPQDVQVNALKPAIGFALGLAVMLVLARPVSIAVISGANRSQLRQSSSLLVVILGYAAPLAAIVFAHRAGTLRNRWAIGCLVASSFAVLLGFRGLALMGVLGALIIALNTGGRQSARTVLSVGVVGLVVILALTALRPQADQGVYGALANRMIYTPTYQIEKTRVLNSEQSFEGQWFLKDLQARAGGQRETLQRAVWLDDYPDSPFIDGSYPIVGDFIGNFGSEWWLFYLVLLMVLWWWDTYGVSADRAVGVILNSCFMLVAARASFFGASAVMVPLVLVFPIWMLVSAWRRKGRGSAGESESTGWPQSVGSNIGTTQPWVGIGSSPRVR